jgi:hypothetical protein
VAVPALRRAHRVKTYPMTQTAERRLEQIADEVERLEDAGDWNLDQFRRLYAAALEACEGEERQLEFFGPFLRGASYVEEAARIGNEYRSAEPAHRC